MDRTIQWWEASESSTLVRSADLAESSRLHEAVKHAIALDEREDRGEHQLRLPEWCPDFFRSRFVDESGGSTFRKFRETGRGSIHIWIVGSTDPHESASSEIPQPRVRDVFGNDSARSPDLGHDLTSVRHQQCLPVANEAQVFAQLVLELADAHGPHARIVAL
jgi:hypothetical protein